MPIDNYKGNKKGGNSSREMKETKKNGYTANNDMDRSEINMWNPNENLVSEGNDTSQMNGNNYTNQTNINGRQKLPPINKI